MQPFRGGPIQRSRNIYALLQVVPAGRYAGIQLGNIQIVEHVAGIFGPNQQLQPLGKNLFSAHLDGKAAVFLPVVGKGVLFGLLVHRTGDAAVGVVGVNGQFVSAAFR